MNSELLKSCRYYRGEPENPFAKSVPAIIWKVERDWVERETSDAKAEAMSERSSEILAQYRYAGLLDFEKSDGVWIGLKASLYRLLQHWSEGVASPEEWRNFYNEWKDQRF